MISMTARIVYTDDDGALTVIIPIDCGLTIEQIAAKDVPAGRPYRIIDAADLPTDRTDRALWGVDAADLVDGVGADYGAGSANVVVGWAADGSPIIAGGTP